MGHQSSTRSDHSDTMKSVILCLSVASLVSGDAKPWTLAQVASGAHVANAVAEGRAHNVGVITNAAVVPAYAGLHHVYYGKREAEPYTPAQVAAGQTNGGLLTYVDYGHGTGHRPIVASPATYTVPAAYSAVYPHVYYGKREADAEP